MKARPGNGETAAAIFREVFGRGHVPAGAGAVAEVAAGSSRGKEEDSRQAAKARR